MIKINWSTGNFWYTLSHKNEQVYHWVRIGHTVYNDMKIYEVQIWKLSMQVSFF